MRRSVLPLLFMLVLHGLLINSIAMHLGQSWKVYILGGTYCWSNGEMTTLICKLGLWLLACRGQQRQTAACFGTGHRAVECNMLRQSQLYKRWQVYSLRTILRNIHEVTKVTKVKSKVGLQAFIADYKMPENATLWKTFESNKNSCIPLFFLLFLIPCLTMNRTSYPFKDFFCWVGEKKGVVNQDWFGEMKTIIQSREWQKRQLCFQSYNQPQWSVHNPASLSISWLAMTYFIKNGPFICLHIVIYIYIYIYTNLLM